MTAPTHPTPRDLADVLGAYGPPRETGADALIRLDREGVWLVHSGRLDVFALGGPAGARGRTHVLRVAAGGAAFGADIRGPDGVALVAVGAPGTTVVAVDGAAARAAGADPARR